MRFPHCKANEADRAVVQAACSVIAATTRRRSATDCEPVGFPLVAKRRTTHGIGLGRWRWVVERTFAWLNQFRRLRVRYDKRADIHEAFLSLRCVMICWHTLRKTWVTI
jgi:transposase